MNVLGDSLLRRMDAVKRSCDTKCSTCGVGVGRWCDHRRPSIVSLSVVSPFVRRAMTGELPAKVTR